MQKEKETIFEIFFIKINGLVIQIDMQKEGGCLSLGTGLIIYKMISLLPSGRNILFLIAFFFLRQPKNQLPQQLGPLLPLQYDFALVSCGPLMLNVEFITTGTKAIKYLLNDCHVPGRVLRAKHLLSLTTLLTVLERSVHDHSVAQAESNTQKS